jgi:predicted O-methyltransferase YrrM
MQIEARVAGWFDFADFYDAAVDGLPPDAQVVEVGCFLGLSTLYLARRLARHAAGSATLWCVDTWDNRQGLERDQAAQDRMLAAHGVEPGRLFAQFCANALDAGLLDRLNVVRAPSAQAARLFGPRTLDFVFLDAGHDYHGVTADLTAWHGKLKPGGLFAGHDDNDDHPELRQALRAYFGFYPERQGRCWQVRA